MSSQAKPHRSSKRPPLATIESCLTRLLVATRDLLEMLPKWAQLKATEADVSDAYVRLGNEFKVTCRAFSSAGVDITDLGDVPQKLREVLESALVEEPSQEILDRFLPTIRKIIVGMVENLKTKKEAVKQIKSDRNSLKSQGISGPSVTSESAKHRSDNGSIVSSESNSSSRPQSASSHVDPLAELERGNTLQRKASKRLSTYQYQQIISYSPGRDPPLTAAADIGSPRSPLPTSQRKQQHTTIFLKIGSRVRKTSYEPVRNVEDLKMLFIEVFGYSPGSDSFPDVYIQDTHTGVSYELEEKYLDEIKEGSILSITPKSSDESYHADGFDQKISALTEKVDLLQKSVIAEIGSIKDLPPVSQPQEKREISSSPEILKKIADLQHQVTIARQIASANKKSMTVSLNKLLGKFGDFQETSALAANSADDVYLENSLVNLSNEASEMVQKTDIIQDTLEQFKKDITQRRICPSPKQIEMLRRDMENTRSEVLKLSEFLEKETPNWHKIWQVGLSKVLEGKDLLKMQTEVIQDLKDDLASADDIFDTIEKCSEQMIKTKKSNVALNLPLPEPGQSISDVKNAVLSEVAALQPKHEERVAAIERAERIRERQKDLERDEFSEELSGVVEGNKLKKSGGIEETERVRRLKDEQNLKGQAIL
ncbi:unnamed protein product [Kuraishia capsulata CBS 1993]|uniref:Actin interacting protein 3 C-terminal domain-containing protein n=1 Tax=Kuraishia capsulata CBS 1993 TaxID=1382522 RepID=W6ML68_9ASCO|nr:uncharacterized protein KUCA_T00003184001 [Kuraishia capsulata CBS 1993]CDK27206.1 unnamed protein product [Kuraishia capsulata CBS 1993]